jgi:hypothetical protein
LCRVGQGLGKDFFHCKVSTPTFFDHHSQLRLTTIEMYGLHLPRRRP